MLLNNQEKGEEVVNENVADSIKELTWHLIKEKLVKANDIKVEQPEVLEMAKNAVKMQFAQYGMMNIPEDVLSNYAAESLKKKEQVEALVGRIVDSKLAQALKAQVTLEPKTVTLDEFNKMFE